MSDELQDLIQKTLTQGLTDTQAVAVKAAVEELSISAEQEGGTHAGPTTSRMEGEAAKRIALLAVATGMSNNARNIEGIRAHLETQDLALEVIYDQNAEAAYKADIAAVQAAELAQEVAETKETVRKVAIEASRSTKWISGVNVSWKLICVLMPLIGALLWWFVGSTLEFHRDLNLDRLRIIIREEINSPTHIDKMKEARLEFHRKQELAKKSDQEEDVTSYVPTTFPHQH